MLYIMSHHRTLVGTDKTSALVHLEVQLDALNGSDFRPIQISVPDVACERVIVTDGPMAGYEMILTSDGARFSKDGIFLCAEPNKPKLTTRTVPRAWETFQLVSEDYLKAALHLYKSPEEEMARFRAAVLNLGEQGKPVKIYCGAGKVPRSGFLNLDITVLAPKFAMSNPSEYFIFPFADMRWDLPDNCVDYVFHEDFIEHIDQTSQFQFLAETLRVLKPGSWHRINTPNLITSMKTWSDFKKGFAGVYTGERRWQHLAIYSPSLLEEVARTIGYREVVFTTRNCGVSQYAEKDRRPLSDRDNLVGNIFADLLK